MNDQYLDVDPFEHYWCCDIQPDDHFPRIRFLGCLSAGVIAKSSKLDDGCLRLEGGIALSFSGNARLLADDR